MYRNDRPYARAVRLSVRGFLFARFIAMVAWALLLLASYGTYRALAPHIGNGFFRWVVNMGTFGGAIVLGNAAQAYVLQRLDPEGDLRRQVREQSEAARRES